MLASVVNGRPMGAEIKRVLEYIKGHVQREGDMAAHVNMRPLLNGADDNRYRRVLTRARKQFVAETGGVFLETVRGVGIKWPSGMDQIRGGMKLTKHSIRQYGKAISRVAMVSDGRLPDIRHQEVRDHIVQQATYIAEMARTEHRALVARIGKPEQLPK